MLRSDNLSKQSRGSDSRSILDNRDLRPNQDNLVRRDSKLVFTNNRSRYPSPFGYSQQRLNQPTEMSRQTHLLQIKINGQLLTDEEKRPKKYFDIFGSKHIQAGSKKTNPTFFLPINTTDRSMETNFEIDQCNSQQVIRSHLGIPYSETNVKYFKAIPTREVSQRPTRNVSSISGSDFRSRSATTRPFQVQTHQDLNSPLGVSLQHQIMENSFKTLKSIEGLSGFMPQQTNPGSSEEQRNNKVAKVFFQIQSKIREITAFHCSCDFFRIDAQGNIISLL